MKEGKKAKSICLWNGWGECGRKKGRDRPYHPSVGKGEEPLGRKKERVFLYIPPGRGHSLNGLTSKKEKGKTFEPSFLFLY